VLTKKQTGRFMNHFIFFLKGIIAGLILISSFFSTAQDKIPEITLGPDEIAENQIFTITLTVFNDKIKSYDNFPDIEGFIKRGQSTSSQTSIVNGQISSSQSVVMNYAPSKQGTFNIKSFTMQVNGQSISSPGKTVKVGPPAQTRSNDPFRNFFDRDPFEDMMGKRSAPEFVDVKDEAFLGLSTSKDNVYVGEGFNVVLAFYIAETNQASLQWYDLNKQLTEILKNIKPANCWEENFNIENINGEPVNIGGKNYTQYKIYQANFYPFNREKIVFPAVNLEMLKYQVARNPGFFGPTRKEDYKTYTSKAKTVNVKELPAHPLRESVAVGNYTLSERLDSQTTETGKSVAYDFQVSGEGNISAIEKPRIKSNKAIEFYEPNIKQQINRRGGRVSGAKTFSYFIIPKEPGTYRLKDHVQFIFFNPQLHKYDTLKPRESVVVSGESFKNQDIASTDVGSFYQRIADADNTLKQNSTWPYSTWAINIFILVMLGISAYLVFKK
jgi:hypothetical protein